MTDLAPLKKFTVIGRYDNNAVIQETVFFQRLHEFQRATTPRQCFGVAVFRKRDLDLWASQRILGLAAGLVGSFLIYQVGVLVVNEFSLVLQSYRPEWGGLLINGFALGGIGGAAVGNFRMISKAFNRPAGLLLSLALAVPFLVLLAVAGLFELAFKIVK